MHSPRKTIPATAARSNSMSPSNSSASTRSRSGSTRMSRWRSRSWSQKKGRREEDRRQKTEDRRQNTRALRPWKTPSAIEAPPHSVFCILTSVFFLLSMQSPSVFLAHGSPISALGGGPHAAALRGFGKQHSDARAIVIVSAHWQTRGQIRVTTWEHAPLLYDFGGFPDELYRIEYPAPGD